MKTLTTLAAVAVLQAALVGAAVAPQLSARVTGDTYQFRVAPLDPMDPFRGAYVTLDYPDLNLRDTDEFGVALRPEDDRGPIYVGLRRDGDVWVAGEVTRDRPSGETPYLACNDRDWSIQCGMDSFFLPQDKAAAMESMLRDGAIAEVRIDGRGHAALVDVRAP